MQRMYRSGMFTPPPLNSHDCVSNYEKSKIGLKCWIVSLFNSRYTSPPISHRHVKAVPWVIRSNAPWSVLIQRMKGRGREGETAHVCGAFDFAEYFFLQIATVGTREWVKSDQVCQLVLDMLFIGKIQQINERWKKHVLLWFAERCNLINMILP